MIRRKRDVPFGTRRIRRFFGRAIVQVPVKFGLRFSRNEARCSFWSLGERRALALREELVRLGVDPTRVDTISYGEDKPVDPGHDEAAWRKNRRGDFILLSPPK